MSNHKNLHCVTAVKNEKNVRDIQAHMLSCDTWKQFFFFFKKVQCEWVFFCTLWICRSSQMDKNHEGPCRHSNWHNKACLTLIQSNVCIENGVGAKSFFNWNMLYAFLENFAFAFVCCSIDFKRKNRWFTDHVMTPKFKNISAMNSPC